MLNGTIVLFSRDTNGKKFSRKCLKQMVKVNKGKVAKIADGTGIVHNIRYNNGQVLADYSFPLLDISCSGIIVEEKNDKVTEFRIDKIEVIQLKTKETK